MINQYQLFGVGVPENREDEQLVMNGHVSMTFDNLFFAGNIVFVVVDALFLTGQN